MLYPMFALVLLTIIVAAHLLRLRIKAVKAGQVRLSQLRLNQSADIPDTITQAARNYSNLFEVPVLFYTAGCLAMVLKHETIALIILAWLFVVARAAHSWIHLTRNNVIHRLRAFMAGNICVVAIWVLLIIHHVQQNN
jgi:hypothetical protein